MTSRQLKLLKRLSKPYAEDPDNPRQLHQQISGVREARTTTLTDPLSTAQGSKSNMGTQIKDGDNSIPNQHASVIDKVNPLLFDPALSNY